MALEEYLTDFARRDWERDRPEGRIRVAIVGVGQFARERALPAIEDGRYCEATTLVTGSPDRAADVADRFGVPNVVDYGTFESGDVADAYDAVYVATPSALHDEYAIAAARQGKHVLCEKPLEVTAGDAGEIVEACDRAGVVLMTAYRLQLEPTVRRTRELIRDGVIGRPMQLHGGFSHPLLEYASPDTWRLDPDLAGGGALVDLGIYPLNTSRFLLESDPVAVRASTASVDEPFADVDEHVAFQLEFPGGVTASCTASFNLHATSQLVIVGTGGKISITSPFGGVVPHEIYVEIDDVGLEYTGRSVDEVIEEFDYFGYCVLAGTDPEPDGRDGLADIRAIEAAYESAETGRRVSLD